MLCFDRTHPSSHSPIHPTPPCPYNLMCLLSIFFFLKTHPIYAVQILSGAGPALAGGRPSRRRALQETLTLSMQLSRANSSSARGGIHDLSPWWNFVWLGDIGSMCCHHHCEFPRASILLCLDCSFLGGGYEGPPPVISIKQVLTLIPTSQCISEASENCVL